ncbi:MAG: putative sterol carrier protein [Bradymonadia bacterium]|jgi:putative sterol carrier protein
MPAIQAATVEEYFATMEQRFEPEGAKDVDAVFQFELSGDEAGTWNVHVKDGAMTMANEAHAEPTTTIKMDGGNFVKMSNGTLSGQMAYMTGKMKIAGSIPMAMKMKTIFPQGS